MQQFGNIGAVGLLLLLFGAMFLLLGGQAFPSAAFPQTSSIYRGKNAIFYFPLTTSILISVVLSLVVYVIGRLKH
jgi:hypothetical protein